MFFMLKERKLVFFLCQKELTTRNPIVTFLEHLTLFNVYLCID